MRSEITHIPERKIGPYPEELIGHITKLAEGINSGSDDLVANIERIQTSLDQQIHFLTTHSKNKHDPHIFVKDSKFIGHVSQTKESIDDTGNEKIYRSNHQESVREITDTFTTEVHYSPTSKSTQINSIHYTHVKTFPDKDGARAYVLDNIEISFRPDGTASLTRSYLPNLPVGKGAFFIKPNSEPVSIERTAIL